jgi:hypothetical protein
MRLFRTEVNAWMLIALDETAQPAPREQASFGLGYWSAAALADVVFLLWDAAIEFTSLHFTSLHFTSLHNSLHTSMNSATIHVTCLLVSICKVDVPEAHLLQTSIQLHIH